MRLNLPLTPFYYLGVEKDHAEAMRWFRKSADQGHAHSAYNLAVGHMQGLETDVQKGSVDVDNLKFLSNTIILFYLFTLNNNMKYITLL